MSAVFDRKTASDLVGTFAAYTGSGFRAVWGLGFRVEGSGLRVACRHPATWGKPKLFFSGLTYVVNLNPNSGILPALRNSCIIAIPGI